MSDYFTKGFLCANCGPVQKSKKRSINKVHHETCVECKGIVEPWERPKRERIGCCSHCGNGTFKLALYKSDLLRKCKGCGSVYNVDRGEMVREGKNGDK